MDQKTKINTFLFLLMGFLSLIPIGIGALFFRSWWPLSRNAALIIESSLSLGCLLIITLTLFSRSFELLTAKGLSKALYAVIALYVIAFTYLTVLKVRHFGYRTGDLVIYEQMYWASLSGRFFYCSWWGGWSHISPFLLLLIPFYYILPSLHLLHFFMLAAIGASAVILYRIALRHVNAWTAFGVVVAYLFHPNLVWQPMIGLHDILFFTPFALLAFDFFEKNNLKGYIITLVLAVSVVEYASLTLLMFSVYAFVKKKGWTWIAPPIVLCAAVFILGTFFIHNPRAGHSDLILLIQTIRADPSTLWRIIKSGSLDTAKMLLPLAFLPLLGEAIIFTLPTLFIEFFLPVRAGIQWHTWIPMTVFLFIAYTQSLEKLENYIRRRKLPAQKLIQAVAVLIVFANLALLPKWLDLNSCRPHPKQKAIEELLAIIPGDRTVTSPRYISYHLSKQPEIYFYENLKSSDYVIFDTSDTSDAEQKERSDYFDSITHRPDYELIFERDGILLYRRKAK